MSLFSDLMAKPLPSKVNTNISESADDDLTMGMDNDGTDTAQDEPVAEEPETGSDIPVENPLLSGEPTPVPIHVEDDDEVSDEDLDPEAEQRIDDTINAVATPILLSDSLTDEEYSEFVESAESDIMMAESFITEKTVIRFDKNARKAQLYEVAVAACARENNDRLYKKLQTVYKMERILKAKLRKKYDAKAKKKVREYLNRAKKSKSGVLSKIAGKLFHKGN